MSDGNKIQMDGMAYFTPKKDITLEEVVGILELIGLGINMSMIPDNLKKHFQVPTSDIQNNTSN